jgi:hypothetical protein
MVLSPRPHTNRQVAKLDMNSAIPNAMPLGSLASNLFVFYGRTVGGASAFTGLGGSGSFGASGIASS